MDPIQRAPAGAPSAGDHPLNHPDHLLPEANVNVSHARTAAIPASLIRDYVELTKPEISFLVAISALAGFLLGSPGGVDGWTLLFALIGVVLTSGGGAVLNHYLEWERDAVMRRTMNRPIPAGRISPRAARNFGSVLVMAGVGLLCPLTNPLTGVLATLTVILYLFVYTPLKLKTTWNTLVGTVPGAVPALGGWTAATGTMEGGGWTIFAILVVWQMPHFLALAWMYRKDYARGGYVMLPVVEPDGGSTVRQTLLYTLFLIPVSLTPVFVGLAGWIYAAGAVALGIYFLRPAVDFYRTRSVPDARRVLKASIYYIPLLVVLILAEYLV